MSRTAKNRFFYIFLNAIFAAPLLLLSILGMLVIDFVLYIIGAVVILIGLISFFPSIVVKIGIFDEFGNEYVATNLFERIAAAVITCLIGGAIAMLPQFLSMPSFFAYIGIMALAIGLGFKLRAENAKYYMSDMTKMIGQLIPFVYMLAGAAFMIGEAFEIGIWFRILVMAIAFALHVYRVIAVNQQAAFY